MALSGLPGLRAGIPTAGLKVLLGFCACSPVALTGTVDLTCDFAGSCFEESEVAGAGVVGLEAFSVFAGSVETCFSVDGLAVRWAAFAADESGRANCEEMMAGSTGAPLTVG